MPSIWTERFELSSAGGIPAGFTGERAGIRYVLASCDAAGFSPLLLDE